jgi:tRNA-splicing ligase RtcB
MAEIEECIPAGVGKGHTHETAGQAALAALGRPRSDLTGRQETTVAVQFGTLGSGNHFVEICLDERDRVWTVLHSGSRGIGNQLASGHIKAAKELARRWHIPLEDPDLAYFIQGTPEFEDYIGDMLWAQRYAMASRARMAEVLNHTLFAAVGHGSQARRINCHHNFTQREHHHGRNLWITRKGAIRAAAGDEGVIPGSRGTRSYIVSGLGNTASYTSCAHGAGRRMSRSAAKQRLTVDSLRTAMQGRAWNHDRAAALLDEHPQAYKNIDQVMADQTDLVTVQHTLRQVFNYKG